VNDLLTSRNCNKPEEECIAMAPKIPGNIARRSAVGFSTLRLRRADESSTGAGSELAERVNIPIGINAVFGGRRIGMPPADSMPSLSVATFEG
jgi:hypothetical protein